MRNVVKTLILVSVCFVLCWVWNQVFFFLYNMGVSVDFEHPFYHFSVVAVFANCCINPIVYLVQYRQFQRRLLQIFCPHRSAKKPLGEATMATLSIN